MSDAELWFGSGRIAAGGWVVLAAAEWMRAWRESHTSDKNLDLQRGTDGEDRRAGKRIRAVG